MTEILPRDLSGIRPERVDVRLEADPAEVAFVEEPELTSVLERHGEARPFRLVGVAFTDVRVAAAVPRGLVAVGVVDVDNDAIKCLLDDLSRVLYLRQFRTCSVYGRRGAHCTSGHCVSGVHLGTEWNEIGCRGGRCSDHLRPAPIRLAHRDLHPTIDRTPRCGLCGSESGGHVLDCVSRRRVATRLRPYFPPHGPRHDHRDRLIVG